MLGFISSVALLLAAAGTVPVYLVLKPHQLSLWRLWLLTPHPDSDEPLNHIHFLFFSPKSTISVFAASINLRVHW